MRLHESVLTLGRRHEVELHHMISRRFVEHSLLLL